MPYKSVDHIALLSCCEAFSPGSNLLKAGNKIVLYLDSMPVSARAFDQQDLRQLLQNSGRKEENTNTIKLCGHFHTDSPTGTS